MESGSKKYSPKQVLTQLSVKEASVLFAHCEKVKFRILASFLNMSREDMLAATTRMYQVLGLIDEHPRKRDKMARDLYCQPFMEMLAGLPGKTYQEKLDHWPPALPDSEKPKTPLLLPPPTAIQLANVNRQIIRVDEEGWDGGDGGYPPPPPPEPWWRKLARYGVMLLILLLFAAVAYLLGKQGVQVVQVIATQLVPGPTVESTKLVVQTQIATQIVQQTVVIQQTQIVEVTPAFTPTPLATATPTVAPSPTQAGFGSIKFTVLNQDNSAHLTGGSVAIYPVTLVDSAGVPRGDPNAGIHTTVNSLGFAIFNHVANSPYIICFSGSGYIWSTGRITVTADIENDMTLYWPPNDRGPDCKM